MGPWARKLAFAGNCGQPVCQIQVNVIIDTGAFHCMKRKDLGEGFQKGKAKPSANLQLRSTCDEKLH